MFQNRAKRKLKTTSRIWKTLKRIYPVKSGDVDHAKNVNGYVTNNLEKCQTVL